MPPSGRRTQPKLFASMSEKTIAHMASDRGVCVSRVLGASFSMPTNAIRANPRDMTDTSPETVRVAG
ncbi:hypothetical protein BSZ39_11620 [Bowdeniella nasicola]|uniref:Uncharacterized protein n=1 Tax=Bowdeniella nasicola TaxID=208480 RepID=A0A1Q5PZI3_9ACTO|nr:hypothetical protein BSZ39_11620 [Bowdeniella nasicola]